MTVAGTLEWMAPEVSLGIKYDQPVDVFSFGRWPLSLLCCCDESTPVAMVMYEVIFRINPPKRVPLTDYAFIIDKYTPPEDTPAGIWDLLRQCVSIYLIRILHA